MNTIAKLALGMFIDRLNRPALKVGLFRMAAMVICLTFGAVLLILLALVSFMLAGYQALTAMGLSPVASAFGIGMGMLALAAMMLLSAQSISRRMDAKPPGMLDTLTRRMNRRMDQATGLAEAFADGFNHPERRQRDNYS